MYQRTKPDVESIIEHAKLNPQQLRTHTQTLYFPEDEGIASKFKLLELNTELLQCLETTGSLQFKGGLNEKIVLCSDKHTYEVKEAEISNSLLVLSNFQFNNEIKNASPNTSLEDSESELDRTLDKCEVLKIFHDYYECREIKPRFRKLYDLLHITKYSGHEQEYLTDKKLLFTYNQLLNTTQCSKMEFNEGLRSFRAFEYEGHLRIADIAYEYRIVQLMMNVLQENSWSPQSVDRNVTVDALAGMGLAPQEIVERLFDIYTKENDGPGRSRNNYSYNQELVCRIVAENILQDQMKFKVEEFLAVWQGDLDPGFIVKEEYLRGIGIIDRDGVSPCVRTLKEINLPNNLQDRLRILFKAKEKWTLDEMYPYIETFSNPQQSVPIILTKFCRSIKVNGKQCYVAKH